MHAALDRPSRPLDGPVREGMERLLSHDFGSVRVHDDARAAASAEAIGAGAFSVGEHVVFGPGRYEPRTPAGRLLLAHELAHVVQQRRRATTGDGGGHLEVSANAAARQALSHRATSVEGSAPLGVYRAPKDPVDVQGGRMQAMTPEDMYNKLIANRGFDEHIPVSQLEATRAELEAMQRQLATTPNPDMQRRYNRLRSRYNLSTLEGGGAPAGQGYTTYAVVQLVDQDGHIIAVADGTFRGGGLHAEQLALQKLRDQLGATKIPGARIDVVSDQTVCTDQCVPAFRKFAEDYDLDNVESFVFRRAAARGTGVTSPKTTARTATAEVSEGLTRVREESTIVQRRSRAPGGPSSSGGAGTAGATRSEVSRTSPSATGRGRVAATSASGQSEPSALAQGTSGEGRASTRERVASEESGGGEPARRVRVATEEPSSGDPGTRAGVGSEETTEGRRLGRVGTGAAEEESLAGEVARTAGKGAALSLGTAVVASLLQEAIHDKIVADLAALPKPMQDRRSARAYLADPKTRSGMKALDLLDKDLFGFTTELKTQHDAITRSRFAALLVVIPLRSTTPEQYETKLRQIDRIGKDLDEWESELFTIDLNLQAVLELEPQLESTAKSADDLNNLLHRVGPAEELLKLGMSYDELDAIWTNLTELSLTIRRVISQAHAARDAIRPLLDEVASFDHQVNQIWWQEFGGQLKALIRDDEERQRRATAQVFARAKVRYGTLEGLDPVPLWNSDQQGTWAGYQTRESEILLELARLSQTTPTRDGLARKHSLEADLGEVRRKMLAMRRGITSEP